jgi:hypothetical protein
MLLLKNCRLKYCWKNYSAGLTSTVCPTILDFISERDVPLYTLYKKTFTDTDSVTLSSSLS